MLLPRINMDTYDENKESNYIMYWDANNLYGTVMTQYLPYDEVKIDNTINIDDVLKDYLKFKYIKN